MTSGVKRSLEEIEDYKAKILEYIQETPGGTFNGACAKFKVGYSTGFVWKKEDPEWARLIEDARSLAEEVGGDFAEGKLMACIQNGEFPAIKYYLGTKHKHRGYIEKSEQHTTGSMSVQVQATKEQRDAAVAAALDADA